jgi:hypothetical protein
MSLWRYVALAVAVSGSPDQDPHAGHHPAPQAPPPSAPSSPGTPAGTLRQDELDAPAATSVEEARRAQPGHHMDHGSYVHQDVGRDAPPPAEEHHH